MRKLGLVLLFGLILLTLSLFGCKVKKYDLQNELTVEYIIGGDLYQSATVSRGACLTTPKLSERSGYIFDGWYYTSDYTKLWEDNSVLYKDLTLYGRWLSKNDDFAVVTFMYEEEILSTQSVQKGKCATEFIPEEVKTGYEYDCWKIDGKSFDFSTTISEDTVLNLSLKLKEYTAEFYCGDVKVDSRKFTIEDTSIDEPPVPYKENYEGAWAKYEIKANDIRIYAVYTPSVYHIQYFALNKAVAEAEYSCVDRNYPEAPQVPKLAGHTGEWKSFEIMGTTVNVFAVYEKLTYELIYTVDGKPFENIIYTYSDVPVNSPLVPVRLGYSCEWESFEYTEETTIIINAVYKPLKYNARFVADGKEIAYIPFDVENRSFDMPDIPHKEGYTAVWEDYELTLSNKVINAVYTPIDYHITFIADRNIISIQTFNVENMTVVTPILEDKPDFMCFWEDYNLEFKDIVVNAIYIPVKKEGGFLLTLSSDGLSYTVLGYDGSDKHVEIPQVYNDLPITKIASNAFTYSQLESIEISDGIEIIEERAFLGCANLERVTISTSVNVIAPYAFSNCTALTYFEFESPDDWAVSKDARTVVGNIPSEKLADSSVAATLYEPMSNYYWIKKSAVS
ncbi:MAG: leucine-rich repeat protein [Clostridia bacterium]|nr:leucine-rich repeat protein [Clostridia bacterium]